MLRKFLSLAPVPSACSNVYAKKRVNYLQKLISLSSPERHFRTMGCPTSKHVKIDITNTDPNARDRAPEKGKINQLPAEISTQSSTANGNLARQDELETETVEGIVCKSTDIGENEMKAFDLEGAGKVLLVKQGGQLSALGYKCTHYGAPLEKGALGNGRIRCQWHGACFNILNGDIEDFPGLDSLPCYQVTLTDNNEVKVRAKRSELQSSKRVKPMSRRDPGNPCKVVVVGGGPSGGNCVETLRQEGFTGEISLICRESYLPYDRIKVSKAMDVEIEKLEFRSGSFYSDYDITVHKNVEAVSVNSENNTVTLNNGTLLNYDYLYLATGSQPRKLSIPGADLKNVLTIREYDDAKLVSSLISKDKDVVVVGASFIAMEVANYCNGKTNSVTLVGRDTVPFKALLGEEIGRAFMELFREKGIDFKMQNNLKRCIGDGSCNVSSVELTDGTTLKADIVIMGVGSDLNTSFLRDSGIDLQQNGSVPTNDYLQTNKPNVYAGGDIAYAPVWSNGNAKSLIGHFGLSHYHGRIAALNIAGKTTPLRAVPYFWTMLFGKSVRYAGHGAYTDIVINGNPTEYKFLAYYLNEAGKVVAVAGCQMDPVVSQFAELLSQGKELFKRDIEGESLEWTKGIAGGCFV